MATATSVPVGPGNDVVSGAELDPFASDGHRCGGRCAWNDPCSGRVGAIGAGYCVAMGAPRVGDGRCMRDDDGCSAGARADVGTRSRSASRVGGVVAARPVFAGEGGATSVVGPAGCIYLYGAFDLIEENEQLYDRTLNRNEASEPSWGQVRDLLVHSGAQP